MGVVEEWFSVQRVVAIGHLSLYPCKTTGEVTKESQSDLRSENSFPKDPSLHRAHVRRRPHQRVPLQSGVIAGALRRTGPVASAHQDAHEVIAEGETIFEYAPREDIAEVYAEICARIESEQSVREGN